MGATPPARVVRAVCGAVAVDAVGHVLLLRRRGEDTWGLPGGGVEPGGTWAQAAVRECGEETGGEIGVQELPGSYSDPTTRVHRYPDGDAVHFFGAVFLAGGVRVVAGVDGEASAVGCFAPGALPDPVFAPDLPVLVDAPFPAGRRFLR